MIIAVAGSGGKTSHIKALAKKYVKAGKKVLVTTTTNMFVEEDTILYSGGMNTSVRAMLKALEKGYCMAGSVSDKSENGRAKFTALPNHIFQILCEQADVVLVEADGAKHMLIKYPNSTEPVIPQGTDEIHLITNLGAIGQKCADVSHRLELVEKCLGIKGQDTITAVHIQKLLMEGYGVTMDRINDKDGLNTTDASDKKDGIYNIGGVMTNKDGIPVKIYPTGADSLYKKAVAACIKAGYPVERIKPEWFAPKPHLFVCGAGHVAKQVVELAHMLEFHITVIDDREEFANKGNLLGADEIYCDDFENAYTYFPLVENAYFVVLTRGHLADRLCVEQILGRKYAYLGMIGSRKKVAATLEALHKEGFTKEQTDTLHAPIGLDIGAQTPAEIAVSIMGQIIQCKNSHPVSYMSEELKNCLEKPGEEGILAVITAKTGSSPRGEGSMMFVTKDRVVGTVGGGTVEYMAICDARKMLEDIQSATDADMNAGISIDMNLNTNLNTNSNTNSNTNTYVNTHLVTEKRYDLDNEESSKSGMICGGTNSITFIKLWYDVKKSNLVL